MYQLLFDLHAQLLKALANPKRLEIIQLLRDSELPVSEIVEMLDLPQANVSQHLMVLREAGVVNARRDGKQLYYEVAHPYFVEACDLMRQVLWKRWEGTEMEAQLMYPVSELVPLVHDPVCGMRLSPKTAGYVLKQRGNEYFFCASGCLQKFKETPNKYVGK